MLLAERDNFAEGGNSVTAPSAESEGRLVANLMHFGRLLRGCGLPVGPAKVLAAVEAVRAVGITSRHDFYWSLHAVFVNRVRLGTVDTEDALPVAV